MDVRCGVEVIAICGCAPSLTQAITFDQVSLSYFHDDISSNHAYSVENPRIASGSSAVSIFASAPFSQTTFRSDATNRAVGHMESIPDGPFTMISLAFDAFVPTRSMCLAPSISTLDRTHSEHALVLPELWLYVPFAS